MAKRANPKVIGAFVVGGVVLLVVMLFAFGSVKLFATRIPIMMYFEGDLSGLDTGAAVNFRGVRIGSVTKVIIRYDPQTLAARIPVYAEIEPDRMTLIGGPPQSFFHPGQNIPLLVQRGLRAQLASESLVTGKLVVQLNVLPETPERLVGADPGYYEIPTIPSNLEELRQSVAGIVNMLANARIPDLITDLRRLVSNLDDKIMALDTSETVNDARALINSVRGHVDDLANGLTKTLDTADVALKSGDRAFQDLGDTLKSARPLVATLQITLRHANDLLTTSKGTIEPGSPLNRELIGALKDVGAAARSLRALTDELEKNPNSILFGKPGGK